MTTLKEHGLFSSRDTLEEALQYGEELISARVQKESRMEAFTAMHVVANTAIRLLTKASITETLPYTEVELDELFAIKPKTSMMEPEEALRLLRTKITEFATIGFVLSKLGSPFAQDVTAYAILAARALGLSVDDLSREVKDSGIIRVMGK